MSNTNDTDADDRATEHALREGLSVNVLSTEAMRRIRQATESEWREMARAPVRRRPRLFAVAASVLGIALAAGVSWLVLRPDTASGAVFGEVASVDTAGLFEVKLFARDTSLAAGSSLHAGQVLDSRGNAIVTLANGGNLRIARASAVEIREPDAVQLARGEIYVDIPPGSHAANSFRVFTAAGEFRHVGTQFAVMIAEGQTRLRVREGEVKWRAPSGESTVAAGTEVTIDRNGQVTQRKIPTAGRDWAWTEAMAPDVIIDNRPLLEFLQWYARETGRRLDIDEQSRKQAAEILMRGSVKGLTVSEALSAVMATTSTLKYELPEGVIRVSSARVSPAPRN
jgi:ferric-dicitrate binding protein FerR (iron transport regulator)